MLKPPFCSLFEILLFCPQSFPVSFKLQVFSTKFFSFMHSLAILLGFLLFNFLVEPKLLIYLLHMNAHWTLIPYNLIECFVLLLSLSIVFQAAHLYLNFETFSPVVALKKQKNGDCVCAG